MFKERIFVLGVSIFAGLILSVGLFYLYQKTKVITRPQIPQDLTTPATSTFSLNVDTPSDEEVFDKNIVQVSGKTFPGAQIIIVLEDKELVLVPASDGSFSANITLIPGVNLVEILSIDSDGKMLKDLKTLTFTREEF